MRYIYDQAGRLSKVIDEKDNVATYNYDILGNLISITRNPDGIKKPEIIKIEPAVIERGSSVSVTITGNNLLGAEITFDKNGIFVSSLKVSKSKIILDINSKFNASLGSVTAIVTTPFGFASIVMELITPQPKILKISPEAGPPTRFVTIKGSGFSPVSTENIIKFNGRIAKVISSESFIIKTRIPAEAVPEIQLQKMEKPGAVTVETNGLLSNKFNFIITEPKGIKPTFISISPSFGSAEGGTRVRIKTNNSGSGLSIRFGDQIVQDISIVGGVIFVTSPPGEPGLVDLIIGNIYGDLEVKNAFQYFPGKLLTLNKISPFDGMEDVPVNVAIVLEFSTSLDLFTLSGNTFYLKKTGSSENIPGGFSVFKPDNIIKFQPAYNLETNVQYEWNITGELRSEKGVPIEKGLNGFFETSNVIDSTSPEIFITPANKQKNVPRNALIMIRFSEPVNPITVNSSSVRVKDKNNEIEGVLSINSDNRSYTFTPFTLYQSNSEVKVTLLSRVADIAGNPVNGNNGIGTDFSVSFTTIKGTDIFPPRVETVDPLDKSIDIDINSPVSVTFTEPVNPFTVNNDTFILSNKGNQLSGNILFYNNNMTATFNPDKPYPSESIIDINILGDVTDISGNNLANIHTAQFTTQLIDGNNINPFWLKYSPYNKQSGIPLNVKPIILFSRKVKSEMFLDNFFFLSGVEGKVEAAVELLDDGYKAVLIPSSPLLPNKKYSFFHIVMTSSNGDPVLLGDVTSRFFTSNVFVDNLPVFVKELSPSQGTKNLPVNFQILIDFSEPVAAPSINNKTIILSNDGASIDKFLELERGNTRLRINPGRNFSLAPQRAYSLRLTTGIMDDAGNPLSSDFITTFITGKEKDITPPALLSITPRNGASNISGDTNITIQFSESINPLTINKNSLKVSADENNFEAVKGIFKLSEDKTTLTFNPDYPLFTGNVTYHVDISGAQKVEDVSGNKMLNTESSSFTTTYSQGTDLSVIPTNVTLKITPERLYGDGKSTANVTLSNLISNGDLLPDGTKVGVFIDSQFKSDLLFGKVTGGVISKSDLRVKVFRTIQGEVSFIYQSPNLSELSTGIKSVTTGTWIYVVSLDSEENAVKLLTKKEIVLFRGDHADIEIDPNILSVSSESYAEIEIVVLDRWNNPLRLGVRVAVTADPVFNLDSVGGEIQGGEEALDKRFKIFSTIGNGKINLVYKIANLNIVDESVAYIQVASVDDIGQITGLLGTSKILLSKSGLTSPRPKILSFSPYLRETGVALNRTVNVVLSRSLNPAAINKSTFYFTGNSGKVDGVISLSDGLNGPDTVLGFKPEKGFMPNFEYIGFISYEIESVDGIQFLNDAFLYFDAGVEEDTKRPYVSLVNPVDGFLDIAVNSTVSIKFNEPIKSTKINSENFYVSSSIGKKQSGRVVMRGNGVYSFFTDNYFDPFTEYEIVVGLGVEDTAGNFMQDPFLSSFVTGNEVDYKRPDISNLTTPNKGNSDMYANLGVEVIFNEPVNPITINSNNIYLEYIKSSISLSKSNTVVTVKPDYPLFPNYNYNFFLSSDVEDRAGNEMVFLKKLNFFIKIPEGVSNIPDKAEVVVESNKLFANGISSTNVKVSNISILDSPVPDGTLIGVTVEPTLFSLNSAGGMISGASKGKSKDGRFLLFETYDGGVNFKYTSPDLDKLAPNKSIFSIIQMVSVDSETLPVSLIGSKRVELYRLNARLVPYSDNYILPADGISKKNFTLYLYGWKGSCPDGTRVGITTHNIFKNYPTGGIIFGGITSPADKRIQIFTSKDGVVKAVFQAPNSVEYGDVYLEVLSVDNNGSGTGFLGLISLVLIDPAEK